MQVQLETPGGLARRLRVQIPSERIDNALAKRLKSIASRAKLPGFRPGKAPMKVIEAQYKASARYEVIENLVRETYPEALGKVQVNPAGYPSFEVLPTPADQGLEYVASFEVYPEIQLDGLSALAVNRPAVEIGEADIDRLVDNLRKARRTLAEVSRPCAGGDTVTVDFVGSMDGEAFAGGKGEDVEFEIGAGKFLPDLETGISGHAAGESFTVDVSFPADYRAEALKGKTAQFAVTLKSVKESLLPSMTDESFLQAHGVSAEQGEAGLRDKAREALSKERNKAIKTNLKNQIMDQLLSSHPIEVPAGLIEQELPRLREEALNRLNSERPNVKLNAEKAREVLPDQLFEATARRRVALGLLIGEVIKVKNIVLDVGRVDQMLDEMSGDYEQPEEVRQYYRSRPEMLQGLKAVALEDQVVDALLAGAQVSEQPMTLEQLLNPQAPAQS